MKKTDISRKPRNRKVKRALRVQYGALPYRFTPTAALEILLVTTRRSKRWIIPKGWPIKGLRAAKSAARGSVHGRGVISGGIDGGFFCRFPEGLGWSPRQAV
jgi:hypothetical protein